MDGCFCVAFVTGLLSVNLFPGHLCHGVCGALQYGPLVMLCDLYSLLG